MKILHIVYGSMQLRNLSTSSITGMALLHYLQVLPRGQLPDPMGALSSSLPLSAIAEVNAAVTKLCLPPRRGYKGEERALYELINKLKSKSLLRTDSAATRHFSKLLETAKLPCSKE